MAEEATIQRAGTMMGGVQTGGTGLAGTGSSALKKPSARERNLHRAIQSKLKDAVTDLTDGDMVALALGLALDQEQWDKGSDPGRAKVKLACLQFIHDVRLDARAKETGADVAASFEMWVGRRAQRRSGRDEG